VTLQATRNNRAVKICHTIAIAGAVHPSEFIPVRNGQLKKLIAFPVQVRLSLAPGSDYQIEPFSVLCGVGRYAEHCRLEEAVFLLLHPIR
jgi:hypothetical protein